jgi:hypothetical protein
VIDKRDFLIGRAIESHMPVVMTGQSSAMSTLSRIPQSPAANGQDGLETNGFRLAGGASPLQ